MPSRPIPLWSRQRGAGLIEVMVGLTAGLMLLGAVAYFVLGSKQVNRTHDNVSRMQESGRTALEVMGRAIRQAGARSNVQLPFAAGALPALEGTERGTEGAIGDADSLTVRYDVQDGGEADCLGTAVASGAVTYLFFVDRTSDPPTLKCTNATGAAAQAAAGAREALDGRPELALRGGGGRHGFFRQITQRTAGCSPPRPQCVAGSGVPASLRPAPGRRTCRRPRPPKRRTDTPR